MEGSLRLLFQFVALVGYLIADLLAATLAGGGQVVRPLLVGRLGERRDLPELGAQEQVGSCKSIECSLETKEKVNNIRGKV